MSFFKMFQLKSSFNEKENSFSVLVKSAIDPLLVLQVHFYAGASDQFSIH